MESVRTLRACKKTPRKQDKSFVASFFQSMDFEMPYGGGTRWCLTVVGTVVPYGGGARWCHMVVAHDGVIQWWRMPLIPALGRQRQVDSWVWGQLGLQREFQDSQSYTEKPCPKKPKPNKQKSTELFLKCVLCPSGVAGRSKFTWDYPSQCAIVTWDYAAPRAILPWDYPSQRAILPWENMLFPHAACSPHATWPCDCALYSRDSQ